MGTNFYAKLDVCDKCGRCGDELHIGKSSAGWCFSLCVHPDLGLNTLDDWTAYLADKCIADEYGDEIALDELLSRIRDRSWQAGHPKDPLWYESNGAEKGPNGLARHKIGRHCVGHGDGTWDYIEGEFS